MRGKLTHFQPNAYQYVLYRVCEMDIVEWLSVYVISVLLFLISRKQSQKSMACKVSILYNSLFKPLLICLLSAHATNIYLTKNLFTFGENLATYSCERFYSALSLLLTHFTHPLLAMLSDRPSHSVRMLYAVR